MIKRQLAAVYPWWLKAVVQPSCPMAVNITHMITRGDWCQNTDEARIPILSCNSQLLLVPTEVDVRLAAHASRLFFSVGGSLRAVRVLFPVCLCAIADTE